MMMMIVPVNNAMVVLCNGIPKLSAKLSCARNWTTMTANGSQPITADVPIGGEVPRNPFSDVTALAGHDDGNGAPPDTG
jgi:hypothetical protein